MKNVKCYNFNKSHIPLQIFYLVINSPQEIDPDKKIEEEIEVVPATLTSHSLVFLDKYTEYRIQILAFNPAGDGPRSKPIFVKTLQGLPSAPTNLRFTEITMNSLKVTWDPPKQRNGDIIGYIVTYETTEQNESKYNTALHLFPFDKLSLFWFFFKNCYFFISS